MRQGVSRPLQDCGAEVERVQPNLCMRRGVQLNVRADVCTAPYSKTKMKSFFFVLLFGSLCLSLCLMFLHSNNLASVALLVRVNTGLMWATSKLGFLCRYSRCARCAEQN